MYTANEQMESFDTYVDMIVKYGYEGDIEVTNLLHKYSFKGLLSYVSIYFIN